jgi:hypothetical protein
MAMTGSEDTANVARFAIDSELCGFASDELTRILLIQDSKFAAHFEVLADRSARAKFVQTGRVVCVVLSIIGGALCTLSLLIDPVESRRQFEWLFLVAFAALGSFAWFAMPVLSERLYDNTTRFRERIRAWSDRRSTVSCRNAARKILKRSNALAPYEARYTLSGAALHAERTKDNRSETAWARDLSTYTRKGHCISGNRVTVLFKRAGSLLPSACILHREPQWIRDVLQRFEIPVAILDRG